MSLEKEIEVTDVKRKKIFYSTILILKTTNIKAIYKHTTSLFTKQKLKEPRNFQFYHNYIVKSIIIMHHHY